MKRQGHRFFWYWRSKIEGKRLILATDTIRLNAARAMIEEQARTRELGFSAFVPEPVNKELLLQTLGDLRH